MFGDGGENGAAPSEVTGLLAAIGGGDRAAVDRLFEKLYEELRRLARRQLAAGAAGETLDTTALVHEAYLRLSHDARWTVQDRRHFFALAGRAMRRVIIDRVRYHRRQKRGGGLAPLVLDAAELPVPERAEELIALDGALDRLEGAAADLAQLVEWRFFAGLSVEEIAELLGVSDRTVKRRWRAARAILYRDLAAQGFAL